MKNLRTELVTEHCFTVKADTPSLSLEFRDKKVMLLYSRLERAEFVSGKITADFGTEILSIVGKNLEKIWEHFQLFELKGLKASAIQNERETECQIDKLGLYSKAEPQE